MCLVSAQKDVEVLIVWESGMFNERCEVKEAKHHNAAYNGMTMSEDLSFVYIS